MNQNNNQDDFINIGEILFYYLSYWKWIVISLLICLSVGVFYLLRTNTKYEIKTSILIKEDNGGISELSILDELGLSNGKNNIDNEIEVLKSADLMLNTINATKYNITYGKKSGLKKIKLHNDTPIKLDLPTTNLDTIKNVIEFTISKKNDGYLLEATYGDAAWQKTAEKFPYTVNFPFGVVLITNNPLVPFTEKEIFVSVHNTEKIAVALSENIKITPTTKKSSVISLVINNENTERGKEFLRKLVDIYNLQTVEDKNQIAHNTRLFIDERLKSLSIELSDVELTVEDFKTENKITDISSEAKLFLEQTGANEEKLKEVETQLNVINYVESFINDDKTATQLIPNLGITDQGLAVLINRYNELTLEKNRIERVSTAENPTVNSMINQLTNMRTGIRNSIVSVRKTLLIGKKDLNREGKITSTKIQQIPRIEREFIEIKRQQQIKESLYLFLLQKREENNLSLAATAPKAKIVSQPRADNKPIYPKKNIVILLALLLGVVIPIAIIYIRDLFQTGIKDKEDLEKTCIAPVLGEIPKNKDTKKIAVGINDTSSMTELFRSLRNDLTFILSEPNKKVITITSTVSGEGKTFIASNLAYTFAMIEKKILLVGLDIRNPNLGNYLGLEKKSGLTSYLAMGGKLEELIEQSSLNPNLHIIQAGIIPPNPNELLNKNALNELFDELRKRYDFIIVDTAPVGIISDTFLVNRISDITLYVTRETVTNKGSILFINDLYENNRLTNLYVILNDADIDKKRYGYHSKYGYKKDPIKKQNNSFSSIKDYISKKR